MEMPGTTPRLPSPRMVPAASAFSVNAPPLDRPGAPLGIGQEQGAGHMSNYRQPLGRGIGAGQMGPPPAAMQPGPPPMPPGPGGMQGGPMPSVGQGIQQFRTPPRPKRMPPAQRQRPPAPPQGGLPAQATMPGAGTAPKKGRVGAGKDLSTAARNKLPSSSFALPGKGTGPSGKGSGSYPIPDRGHAQAALSRVSQHGTPAEKATVRSKVKAKFGMGNKSK